MEKRWLFSLFYFLSVPSITGQSLDVITETEVVHTLPGSDVTLVCIFPKPHTTYIIQTQWSKTDDSQSTKIAVYHPIYGTHYFKFSEASYNFSVSFSTRKCCSQDDTESLCSTNPSTTSECNRWALHLKNVTVSLSGQYECSFATYPYGTKAAKIQLVAMTEEEQHYLKKVWLNQTLEIPCLEDTTSENLSTYPLKWLVERGTCDQGALLSCLVQEQQCTVWTKSLPGFEQSLKIFPTKITDGRRVFSCQVMYHPERVQKSSTTVKVFAYPKISVSLQEGSVGTSQKPSMICVMRKAFPKPTLMWYMDRVNLAQQQGDNRSNEASFEAFTTTVSEDPGNSTLTSAVMTASEPQSTSLASLDATSLANLAPASITQDLNDSSTKSPQSLRNARYSSENTTVAHRNLSYTITDQTAAVTRGKDFFTASSLLNSTGDGRIIKASHFPWPTVVALLLLFCGSLIAVGIRKWCQYQQEIINRPPSFKPPPPPIKYTSMVESDGTPPSCHELVNL